MDTMLVRWFSLTRYITATYINMHDDEHDVQNSGRMPETKKMYI